jgi:hypothetical protein
MGVGNPSRMLENEERTEEGDEGGKANPQKEVYEEGTNRPRRKGKS